MQSVFAQQDFYCTTDLSNDPASSTVNYNKPPDWVCLKYVRVNVAFIGPGNHTATSSPVGPNYTGLDYANAVIIRMNDLLSHNIPMNIGNGWLYYSPEANVTYSTPHYEPDASWVMPPPAPDPGFRFVLGTIQYAPNATGPAGVTLASNALTLVVSSLGSGCGGYSAGPSYGYGLIYSYLGTGCDLCSAGTALHELFHAMGLNHNFFRYSCPSANCTGCLFFDENHNVMDITVPPSTSGDGDYNDACNSDYNTVVVTAPGPWYNPDGVADTPPCNDCNYLWTDPTLATTNPMGFRACNEPIEIDNNVMNYAGGHFYGHAMTQSQINAMHNYINSRPTIVVSTGIETAINGQNPYLTTCTVGNSGNEDFICIDQGASTTLSSSSNWSIASYAWSNGATTPTITVSTPDTYTVTVTNSAGCTGTDRIVVKAPAVHVAVPDDVFCGEDTYGQNPSGYSLGYTTTGNTAIAQTWSNGITTPTTIVYPNGSGVYTVTVTAANGCTASDSGNIIVHDSPNPTVQSNNPPSDAFCSNTSIDLSTTISYDSYTWVLDPTPPITPNEILGTSPTLHVDGATFGSVIFNVIVTDANGCTGQDGLWLDHYPAPDVAMNALVTDCVTTLQLTTPSTNSFPVAWSTGATGTTTVNTPATIAVNQAGVYAATAFMTGIDVDGNPHTCTTTVQQTVSPNQIQPVDFSGDYIVGTTIPALGNRVGDIETWDSPNSSIRVAGKVIIPNGKRLIIKNTTTVEMVGENAGIDVAKNAVLFLKENSVLRGDACNSSCWRGVVVDGDWQAAHPAPITYLASGSINHGLVRIETEGTIRDAKVAVASQSIYTSGGLTTIVAGGIIYVSDANFLNNLVDIKMERQNATVAVAVGGMQRSVITHCEFRKTAPFTCPTTQKYGCISLNSSSSTPTLLIEENLFTTENLSGEDKGTGIRITNDKVYVQSNNIFQDLFKGIDVFNTLTTIKAVRVVNNQFNNVTKGVTMNNVVGGKIEHNQFNIPSGTSTVDAYGINLFGSKSVHVLDNDFFAAQNSDYARGLIANNTFYDAYPTNVVNNEFNGRFQEATRFSNNDHLLQMQCNSYDACQKDWYFDATAQLDPQGVCDPEQSSKALRNHFHYIYGAPTLPVTGEHIYIAPGNTFFTTSNKLTLRTDNSPQSLPQNVNNAAIIDADPCFPSGFINTSCTINFPAYEDPMQGCANTNTSNSNLLAAISRMLDTDQTDSLLHLLDCLNTDWAVRLLVGTYTDRGEYAHARELLDVLPNDAENTEFKNIYIAILNELQGNTGGRVTPAKSILEQYSRQRNSRHQTLAESALATYFGFDYVRNIEGEKTQQTTDSALANFTLIPNPAQDMVTIEIPDFTAPVLLRIFDISGREVKQVWLPTAHATIPTQTLGTGIYICKLSDSVGSQKLVIIK